MRRIALLTALFACLAAPAAAGAATIYVDKGAGFGHGIGMSQYGAQGFAQHGWGYKRILTHYYSHTKIGRASTRNVRVLLRSGGGGVVVSHVSRGGSLFDQYSDTRSQVYLGMAAEQRSTNAAAHATAGQVVLYHRRVATTYYFSTSGGRTENIENVWYGSPRTPYLRGVKDPYDGGSARHRWQFRFSASALDSRLGAQCPGSFRRIKILKRGYSPRVVRAQVICSRGRVRASGQTLRSELGLYDTWFTVTRAPSKASRKSASGVNVPLLSGLVHPRTISGSFDPLPSDGYVDVELLDGGRWQLVARGLTNSLGEDSVPVYEAGTYRVSAAGGSAPSVDVH